MMGDVEGLAAVRASSVCKETPKNVSKIHYSKNGDDLFLGRSAVDERSLSW
jgi:hypothetical protein